MGRLSDFGSFASTGNIGIQRNNGGLLVQDNSLPGHWARITGGSQPYSHISVAPNPSGAWQDLPTGPLYEWGSVAVWPASENNGRTDVPDGVVVWLEPEYYTPGYRFTYDGPGAGQGSGSGHQVLTNCCPNQTWQTMRCVGDDLYTFTVHTNASGSPGPAVAELFCAGFCATCPSPPAVPPCAGDCPPDTCLPVVTDIHGSGTRDLQLMLIGEAIWTGGTADASAVIDITTGNGVVTNANGDQIYLFPDAGFDPRNAGPFALNYSNQIYSPTGGGTSVVLAIPTTVDNAACPSPPPPSPPLVTCPTGATIPTLTAVFSCTGCSCFAGASLTLTWNGSAWVHLTPTCCDNPTSVICSVISTVVTFQMSNTPLGGATGTILSTSPLIISFGPFTVDPSCTGCVGGTCTVTVHE